EALANDRLFRAPTAAETLKRILESAPRPLGHVAPAIDEVLRRALATDREARYPSAIAFGTALRDAAEANRLLASADRVGSCVRDLLAAELDERRRAIRARAEPSSITRRSAPRQAREETEILDEPTQAVPRPRPRLFLLGIFALIALALAVVYADMRPRPTTLAVGLPEVEITPSAEVEAPEVKVSATAEPVPAPPPVISKPRAVPKPTPSTAPTFDPNPY
ncbi:MAG TPA: hypothetical protein VFB62_02030, partial [Polyangiaceae bacterium]|nr:hypothetical protein [Polyangiaceae bacterium]